MSELAKYRNDVDVYIVTNPEPATGTVAGRHNDNFKVIADDIASKTASISTLNTNVGNNTTAIATNTTAIGTKLNKAGDTMSGTLNMGSNAITNVTTINGGTLEFQGNKNQPNGYLGLDSSGNAVGTWLVRQGTTAGLSGVVAATGEPILNTDTGQLYVGWNSLSPGIAVGRPVIKTQVVDYTTATAVSVDPTGYDVVRLTCDCVDIQRSKGLTLTNGTTLGQRFRLEWDFTCRIVSGFASSILVTFTDILSNAYKMTSGVDDSGTGFGDAGSMVLVWTDFGGGYVGWFVESYTASNRWSAQAVFPYSLNIGNGNSVGKMPLVSSGIAGCGAIGSSNVVSGNGSFAVGNANILQADYMMAVGNSNGQTGTSNMGYSLLVGQNNRAGHLSTLAHGQRAKGGIPYGYYHASESAGASSSWGTSQYERHVPCGQTTDATPKDLKVGNTNLINDFVRLIGNGSAGAYDISVVGWSQTVQDSFAIWFRALFQRDTSGNTTLVGSTEIARISGSNMTGCNVTLTSSATNNGHVAITVTGLASNTITWTAVAKAVISQQVTR